MKLLTLARKPTKLSVAENVIEHGCGAININETRISGVKQATAGKRTAKNGKGWGVEQGGCSYVKGTGATFTTEGRWPANTLFQHHPDCEKAGTKAIPGYTINRWSDGAKPFGGGAGHEYEGLTIPEQEVDDWRCVPECSLRALHNQNEEAYQYFKQVQSEDMAELSEDLLDYLQTLIEPPEGNVLLALDLSSIVWEDYEDESLHGILFQGGPGEYMEEVWRVLKPGAHLVSLGTDEEPTNHTAACALEDKGFEIRDSILLVQEPGRIHYVTKCGTKERNAGVPVDDAGKQNIHPTVKPKGIMRKLMENLPKGAHVVDPFMGSGSTGVACVEAGYSFTGVELGMDHLKIADARISFWDTAEFRPWQSEVSSDAVKPKSKPKKKLSLRELRDLK